MGVLAAMAAGIKKLAMSSGVQLVIGRMFGRGFRMTVLAKLGILSSEHRQFTRELEATYRHRAPIGDVDNVVGISSDEFMQSYGLPGVPVVLRGSAADWPAMNWTLETLAADFGDVVVCVRSGSDYDDMKLSNINMREYIGALSVGTHLYLGNNLLEQNGHPAAALDRDLRLPPHFPKERFTPASRRLWFGGDGSGAHLHRDLTDNFIVQIFGRKNIVLCSPSESDNLRIWEVNDLLHSSKSHIINQSRDNAATRNIEASLSPGDILYIPCGWFHEVRNIGFSCSISYFGENSKLALPAWDRRKH